MDTQKTFSLIFSKDQTVPLKLRVSNNDEMVFSAKFYDFDFENGEKTTLEIIATISETKESDKRYTMFYKIFGEKKAKDADGTIENTTTNE